MAFFGQFIALWVLWLVWELLLASRYAVGKPREVDGVARPKSREEALSDGVQRAQRLARDALLTLLIVLSVNFFASGGLGSVNALAWIYVGFVGIWLVVELMFDKALYRLLFWLVKFALALAIIIVAYAAGWSK